MSNFAILRTAKISGKNKLLRAVRHNAYPEHRKGFTTGEGGVEIIKGNKNAYEDFGKLIDKAGVKKIRKDAVLAVEFVCSFSPERKGDIDLDKWKKDTLDFFVKKYGKARILQAVVHTDETTPHMHILMVPLVKKQHKKAIKTTLSAKDLVGGKNGPQKLTRLQDEYAEAMQAHGLDRGIKGSKRKNVPLAQFIKEANQIRKEVDSISGPQLSSVKLPKQAVKRILGVDYKRSYSDLAKAFEAIKKKLDGAYKEIKKLTKLNKTLSRNLHRVEAEKAALEQLLSERGADALVAENQELQADKRQHSAQIEGLQQQHDQELAQVAQERDEARQVADWWEQGYHGKDPEKMNPRMRQWCEEQRSQRPQGVDNDRALG